MRGRTPQDTTYRPKLHGFAVFVYAATDTPFRDACARLMLALGRGHADGRTSFSRRSGTWSSLAGYAVSTASLRGPTR